MKKCMTINKKISLVLALTLASSLAFTQEADDGFVVPLNEDFSKAIVASPAQTSGTASASSVKQGLFIEVTSSNQSIIRDIATGKKKGYEFDNAHFLTKANWWFWGDISPKFHLDAEIAVWNTDKTLYKANSYADNVPDVTWGDGFQSLASIPFSFIQNLNDKGIGAFNKMGFTVITPFVESKFGYGDLKENGMLDFDGIYHVIDRWNYVGKGFTEVSLGKSLRKHGDITLNATTAFSMMRGTYGMYDLLDVKYGDEKNPLVEGAFTYGSYTTEEELFRYNKQNINAVSAYFASSPIEHLKFEVHGLGTFGTDVDFDKNAMAFAGRAGWKCDKFELRVMESLSAKNVNSVWGSDGKDYDDINANKSTTQVDFAVNAAQMVSVGLDETVSYVLNDESGASKHNQYAGYTAFRTQPFIDFDLNAFTGKDLTVGLYGVMNIDKITENTKTDKDVYASFRGAGIELKAGEVIPKIKKFTLDYALKGNSKWQMDSAKIDSNNDYDLGEIFHSVMLSADVTDNLSVTAATLYRQYSADMKESFTQQPLGLAFGFEIKKIRFPGRPKFWMHFTYGMDPYEDKNYLLFRADDKINKPLHRTYLLNTLDAYSKGTNVASYIRLGLIWDLK